MKRAIVALVAFFSLLFVAQPASALEGENWSDYFDMVEEKGYEVQAADDNVNQWCGRTQGWPYYRVVINFGDQCVNTTATLAHELGHVMQAFRSGSDRAQFQGMLWSGQSFSSVYCPTDPNEIINNPALYYNSHCEVYAAASAVANNQPHGRPPGYVTINSNMVRQAAKDLLIEFDPIYACRIAKHYNIWLGRAPDVYGYQYWAQQVWQEGFNLDYLPYSFSNSTEYHNSNVSQWSNWGFAKHMINQAFGRPAYSNQEIGWWRDYINQHGRVEASRVILTSGTCASEGTAYFAVREL